MQSGKHKAAAKSHEETPEMSVFAVFDYNAAASSDHSIDVLFFFGLKFNSRWH